MTKTRFSRTRRQFFKDSVALSASSMVATQAMGLEKFIGNSNNDDYKALVFVFLDGGNDAFNTLVPKAPGNLRDRYEEGRGIVALPTDDLHAITPKSDVKVYGGESYNGFGVHPACQDMATLFNDGELSFICNVGNIIQPITREAYLDKTAVLPPQLFSHADQQRQYQSDPTVFFSSGWGGRIAEALESYNANAPLSSLLTTSGLNSFQVTPQGLINPYVLSRDGLVNLKGFYNERAQMMEAAMASPGKQLMGEKFQQVYQSMQLAQTTLGDVFDVADASDTDFDGIFAQAGVATDSKLGKQLKTVAQLIAGRRQTNNQRPVYYVRIGGFDTHQQVLSDHQELMTDLNAGLKAFADVLKEIGDFDKTLTFVGSEFGRTFTPNGSDAVTTGTDHAWGGHAIAMGGMVEGGHLFGEHPDLLLDQGLDASNGRGRWIPTTSVSQCSAVIANWMGVAPADIPALFPSMTNFPSPYVAQSNLSFIKSGVAS